MIFPFYTFVFFLFAFKLKRQRELVTKMWTVQLSLLFPHFLKSFMRIISALFVSLWSLIWKWGGRDTAYLSMSSASLSRYPSSSSSGWKQVWLFMLYWRVEHYSWAMISHMDQIYLVPRGTGGLCFARHPGVFVTKNPHSPRVWSADVSSIVGRDGSRSTSRSSLCLDWWMRQEKLESTSKKAGATQTKTCCNLCHRFSDKH